MIFQIFLILFAVFAIAKTYRQYKKQRVSVYWLTVWSLLWFVVIAVALWPQTTDILATFVGVEKGADLLVYTAVVVLYYLLYRSMVRQERTNKELTDLVRQIAILEAKKSLKKSARSGSSSNGK